jgi:hypothetical protein
VQLCLIWSLSIVVAIVIHDYDGQAVKSFIKGLGAAHWRVSLRAVSYLEIGASIANSCMVITAVHSSCTSNIDPLVLKPPPAMNLLSISLFVWEPFNRPEHSISFGQDDVDFNKDETCKMIASTPKLTNTSSSTGVVIKYYLHHKLSGSTILAGFSILSGDSVCPPFESCPNQNLFQQCFGLEFHHDGCTYVCAISTFEFAQCFNLINKVQYCMSHKRYKFGLNAAMPSGTSAWLFEHVHSHLGYLCNSKSKIFLPNQFVAPAAPIQT